MSPNDLVRAWKDPDVEDRSDHPAGAIDVAVGGATAIMATERLLTMGCCGGLTQRTCKGCDDDVIIVDPVPQP